MTEPRFSSTRERHSPEDLSSQHNESSQNASNNQNRRHPYFLPAFWDNLSIIHLTKLALEELDRRNTQATLRSHELKKSFPSFTPAASYLCHFETSGLENMKEIAKHGGPDLSDLRGHPKPSHPPAMSLTQSSSPPKCSTPKPKSTFISKTRPSTDTPATANTGPYDRNFAQSLIDRGVYPNEYEYPNRRDLPQLANRDEINRRLAHRRPSLSPSRFTGEDFRKFTEADTLAAKEQQVIKSVIPIIEGDIEDAKCVSGGIPFNNLDRLTDGSLVSGKPDIYYGARPQQLDRRVRNDLSGYIIPSTQDDLPILPNFFLEVKGPNGSFTVATKQATYDGALGARGMLNLKSYGQEELIFDNNASTITFIYHSGQLKMFTIRPIKPTVPGSLPQFLMSQLNAWSMTSNIETFRQGATWYRNSRDWAKEQRDEVIRQANGRVDEYHAGTLNITQASLTGNSNTTAHLQESGTSSDELAVDHKAPVKLSIDKLKGSPQSGRKRRKVGDSDYDLSQQSELQSSEPSRLSQQFENQVLGQQPDTQPSREFPTPSRRRETSLTGEGLQIGERSQGLWRRMVRIFRETSAEHEASQASTNNDEIIGGGGAIDDVARM